MRKVILLTVLMLRATAARADNGSFYLGAGVTSNSLTDDTYFLQTDLKNNKWKAFAGVRPFKWVAIEAEYIDIGSGGNSLNGNDDYNTTHADSSAWAAYAVGFLPVPLPVVEFYGKVGIARSKLNSSLSTFIKDFPPSPSNPETTSTSSAGTGLAVGIGVQAHISIVGVRLEYEAFEVNRDYAKVASLSVFLTL
jgi:hypothetical protein